MAHHLRLSALSLAVALFCLDLVLPVESAAPPRKGHVHLPFSRVGTWPRPRNTLSRRDASTVTSAGGNLYAFVVDVQVGTPPQDMSLIISTTTGETWVQDSESTYCGPQEYYDYPEDDPYGDPIVRTEESFCKWGAYNMTLSSTFQDPNQQYEDFSASLADSSSVYGQNFTDKFVVGDIELSDMSMGLVMDSYRYAGVLGLGFNSSDSYYSSYSSSESHPGFLDRLLWNGQIATKGYSIWLDDAEGKSGNLLLGAVDQSRYEGDLLRIKAINEYAYPGTFGVTVDGFDWAGKSDSEFVPLDTNDFPLGVTIGPAEVFSYVPTAIMSKIADLTGAVSDSESGFYFISCNAVTITNDAKFAFRLSGPDGPVLNFETADLVVAAPNIYPYGLPRWPTDLGDNMCLLAIQDGSNTFSAYSTSTYNFGSAILRRSYLAFDLENREVAIAPVRFTSTGDSPSPTIIAFASSGAPVPTASLYCGDSSCEEYCSYMTCDYSLPTSSSSPYPPYGDPSSGDYRPGSYEAGHWRNIAIGVGVSLGIVVLVAGIALTVVWGRICRGKGRRVVKDIEGDDGEEISPDPARSMVTAGPRAMRMDATPVVPAPGTLAVIREDQEDVAGGAPQLPGLSTNLSGPMTPPEPLTPGAVSAVSAEDAPVAPTKTSSSVPPTPKQDATQPPQGNGAER